MGSAAFYLYIPVPVSKQDLKHFSKSDLPGFTGGVFMDFCPRRATEPMLKSKSEKYKVFFL